MECEFEQVDFDVNNSLSSSHKRVNCNPAAYYTPEPKRQQLSMPLAADNLPTLDVLGDVFDENDKFNDDIYLNPIADMDANGELFFDCELKNFNCDGKNETFVSLPEKAYPNLMQSGLNSDGNTADSKNDVSSLLEIVGSTSDDITSILNYKDTIVTECTNSDDINEETCKDEEDMFLRNLPTSVDDFQNKEFYLKLERNVSSPHVSRLQSPSACLPDFSTANCTIASTVSAMTGSSANSFQSSESGSDQLDDNDLEVAMINESFEEQQKQSKIYDCMDLKSLFYGIPVLPPGIHHNSVTRVIDPNKPSTSEYYAGDEFNRTTGSTTPVKSSEFIPLLTPKSRKLLMRRRRPTSQQQYETTFDKNITYSHDQKCLSTAGIVNHEQVFDSILATSNCNKASEQEDDLEMEEEESRRLDMKLEKMMLSSEENEHHERFIVSSIDCEIKPNGLSNETPTSNNVDFDSPENKLISRLMRQNRVSEVDVDVLNRLPFIVHMPLTSTSNLCGVSSLSSAEQYSYIDVKSAVVTEHKIIEQPFSERRKEDHRKSSLDEACRAAEDIAYGVVASLFDSPIPECFDDDSSRSPVILQGVSRSAQQSPYATTIVANSPGAFTSFCFSVEKENAVDDENSGLVEENNAEDEEDHSIELNQAVDDYSMINTNVTPLEKSEFCKNGLLSLKDDANLSSTSCDMKKSLYVNSGFSGQLLSSMNSSSTSVGDVGNIANFDEQKVPVLDNWENLADDQELAAKVISSAKSNFKKLKAVKNVERFSDGCSHDSKSEQDFPLHVLEANCQVSFKSDREVEEAIQFLIGAGSGDVWYKKVDDRNFLLVFPSAEKASEALFLKNSSVLKLKALSNASPQSRIMSIQWRSMLVGNKRRPTTTASVARRMIANSLNIRIPVSDEQRRKETKLLNSARDSKIQQNLIWND